MSEEERAEIEAFVAERVEVLRSLDVDRLLAFHAKWNPGEPPMPREIAEVSMHKARTADMRLTRDERTFSRGWLLERRYQPLSYADE